MIAELKGDPTPSLFVSNMARILRGIDIGIQAPQSVLDRMPEKATIILSALPRKGRAAQAKKVSQRVSFRMTY